MILQDQYREYQLQQPATIFNHTAQKFAEKLRITKVPVDQATQNIREDKVRCEEILPIEATIQADTLTVQEIMKRFVETLTAAKLVVNKVIWMS